MKLSALFNHPFIIQNRVAAALVLAAAPLFFPGCLKTSLEPRDFFEVRTETPSADKVGMVRLTGTLTFIDDATQVDECGFLLSADVSKIEDGSAPRIKVSPPPPGNRDFTLDYLVNPGDARIYFRAYARIGERLMLAPLSVQHNYRIGDMVAIATFLDRQNDAALMQSSTVELEQTTGKKATNHGFVYSPTNKMPELDQTNCPDCDSVDLAEIFGNKTFEATLPNLKLNSEYHVRAFAIVDGICFYSPETVSFEIKDGWKFVGTLPAGVDGLSDGAFAAVESLGKAFGGFGCHLPAGLCSEEELSRDFFEFNQALAGDSIYFNKTSPFPPNGIRRTNASVFTVGEAVFVFFGEKRTSGNRLPMTNFWKYLPQTDNWIPIPDPPVLDTVNFPRPRSGAAVFVLGGKAYFGGGEMLNLNTPDIYDWAETNEVWQFDPVSSQWKRMADLPVKRSVDENPETTIGRFEAVGFTIPDYGGYFGGGLVDGLMLKDFWRFNPPTAADSTGSWNYVAHLPPEAKGRTETVAFALGQRAYLGTGRHLTDGDLQDFWEFDPATGNWQARESFPGRPRALAFGFSLRNFGYIGGGISRVGASLPQQTGVWRYEPEQ